MGSSGREPSQDTYGWHSEEAVLGTDDQSEPPGVDKKPTSVQSNARETGDGKVRKRTQLIAATLLLIIVIAGLVVLYLNMKAPSGPYMELKCELPYDRPSMRVLTIVPIEINGTGEAQAYAGGYFPQFADVEFVDEGGYFHGEIDLGFYEERIWVYPDGVIDYFNDLESYEVSPGAFSIETSRNLSLEFIALHGGVGQYEETYHFVMGAYDDDRLVGIRDCSFYYHKRFDGYLILGAEGICTISAAINGTVISYQRSEFTVEAANITRQVISAGAAYHALVRALGGGDSLHRITVTSCNLCYYVEDSNDAPPVIHTTWHFVGSDLDFYIDAFTGENLSGFLL
jgi:hypothetical protein